MFHLQSDICFSLATPLDPWHNGLRAKFSPNFYCCCSRTIIKCLIDLLFYVRISLFFFSYLLSKEWFDVEVNVIMAILELALFCMWFNWQLKVASCVAWWCAFFVVVAAAVDWFVFSWKQQTMPFAKLYIRNQQRLIYNVSCNLWLTFLFNWWIMQGKLQYVDMRKIGSPSKNFFFIRTANKIKPKPFKSWWSQFFI